ncbi:ABC sugar transport ATP binding protein [Olavius sp. associated proteobacterium Delta 1]|nr:ABC sugar transport ATP binding protein [Olavius sp. associated proteobacterium Delta 1]
MADTSANPALLTMSNISKSFGEVDVLTHVDFAVGTNEIVGLIGDNGAGKSTLIKIITGVHPPTGGQIYFKGEKITRHSVKRSRELGIETVYQERALADQQALWRNVFAGRELTYKFGFLKVKQQKAQTDQLIRQHMGFTSKALASDSMVLSLSGGEKQGVAIGRALYFEADLIILDEPTMGLSLSETRKVLDFVHNIKQQGRSAIFISHNIYYVYPVADRFVILDRGNVAGEFVKQEISQEELVDKMVQLARTGKLNPQ